MRRARRGRFGGRRPDRSPPVSFATEQKRTQRRVPDDRHRGRVDRDALEQVQVQPERVGDDRLDHVAVAARQPRSRPAPCSAGQPGVPVSDRRDRRAPTSRPSTRRPGRHRGRRVRLHDLPQRLLGQRLERLPGPVAVVGTRPAGRPRRRWRPGSAGRDRLPAADQRAGDHRRERQTPAAARRSPTAVACARPVSSSSVGWWPGEHAAGVRRWSGRAGAG